jgi:hypothetical protein
MARRKEVVSLPLENNVRFGISFTALAAGVKGKAHMEAARKEKEEKGKEGRGEGEKEGEEVSSLKKQLGKKVKSLPIDFLVWGKGLTLYVYKVSIKQPLAPL